MSVFHRIDDSATYPDSARWFERAEQLVHYDGAVRALALREAQDRHDRGEDIPPVPPGIVSDEMGLIVTGEVRGRA